VFQTEHLGNLKVLWVSIFVAAVLAGCGSGSDTSSPASPDANRYFGDHPGQQATSAAIGRDDCRVLRRAVEGQGAVRLSAESEPSPPSSRCLLRGGNLRISIYLDAAYAARQRYANRMVEQVQFYGTDPAKRPHAVAGVGDRSAHEHTASWIPAFSTLYAVRGNRWLTIAYADPSLPRPQREAAAAALARRAFRLTARKPAAPRPSASPARR
jgi:hypothetical protein